MARVSAARTRNSALIGLREDVGLSQDDLAEALNALAGRKHKKYPNVTKKIVGRWERGEVVWPQPFYRRLLAEFFDCAADELGFQRPRRTIDNAPTSAGELLTLVASPGTVDPRVDKDQQDWKDTRGVLGTFRRGLAVAAERLYPDSTVPGSEGSGVIAGPDWRPSVPVPLSELVLELDTDSAVAAIDGSERQSAGVRPLASAEQRYHRYSHAVRDLAAPRLFENRLCFRLTTLDRSQPNLRLRFDTMGFFDSIDTNEALAHEMAAHHLVRDQHGDLDVGRASWRRLTLRKHVGDPFDLSRRPLLGAIGTLTVRAGESPSMVLHQRDGGRVAGWWRDGPSVARRHLPAVERHSRGRAERLLDLAEHAAGVRRGAARARVEYDGSGRPIDYANSGPFAGMDRARNEGRIRVHYLGVTLDALTLSGDLLTVAVIEPDTYDELFGEAVTTNDEGRIPARPLPFEANTISRLHELGQLSPGASAAANLA